MAQHRARAAVAKQFCAAVALLAADAAVAAMLVEGQGLGQDVEGGEEQGRGGGGGGGRRRLDGFGVCREVCTLLKTYQLSQSQPFVPVTTTLPGQYNQNQSQRQGQGRGQGQSQGQSQVLDQGQGQGQSPQQQQQQGSGGGEGVVVQALGAIANLAGSSRAAQDVLGGYDACVLVLQVV